MKIEEIKITMHAASRGAQRGISEEEIRSVVRTGRSSHEGEKGERDGMIWSFTKMIARRRITVVGEVVQVTCFVITAYVETR